MPTSARPPSWTTATQIGALGGREPVRDHDDRASLHQPLERVLDEQLGAGIERRRRFVEHDDRGIGEGGADERDELALTGREVRTPLVDFRVETVGERRRSVRSRSERVDRGVDVGVGRSGPGDEQVVADRPAEEEALLGHHDDALAQ